MSHLPIEIDTALSTYVAVTLATPLHEHAPDHHTTSPASSTTGSVDHAHDHEATAR